MQERRYYLDLQEVCTVEPCGFESLIPARRETDLDALIVQLAEAVQSSLQPERVSIWLKETG